MNAGRADARIGIAVFSRFDSKRLPGKALLDIEGRPMLGRVLDRVRLSSIGARQTVVATSDRAPDDAVADFAEAAGCGVFRGALDDVLGRALALCVADGLDALVRISGDSPFIDPPLIDHAVQAWQSEPDLDLVTNLYPRSYPVGVSVEVIASGLLARLDAGVAGADDREHVTRAVYADPGSVRLLNLTAPEGAYDGVRLVVDTPDDLALARALTRRLGAAPEAAALDAVVDAYRAVSGSGE